MANFTILVLHKLVLPHCCPSKYKVTEKTDWKSVVIDRVQLPNLTVNWTFVNEMMQFNQNQNRVYLDYGVLSRKFCSHWSSLNECKANLASLCKELPAVCNWSRVEAQTIDFVEKHISICLREFLARFVNTNICIFYYFIILSRMTSNAYFIEHLAKPQFNVAQLFWINSKIIRIFNIW